MQRAVKIAFSLRLSHAGRLFLCNILIDSFSFRVSFSCPAWPNART